MVRFMVRLFKKSCISGIFRHFSQTKEILESNNRRPAAAIMRMFRILP